MASPDSTSTSFYDAEHRSIGPHNACVCGKSREVEVTYNDFNAGGELRRMKMEAHTTGLSLSFCFGWGGPAMTGPGTLRGISITRGKDFIPVRDFDALILLHDGDVLINHPKCTGAGFYEA